ncbi:MAG: hypothetical protein MUO85_07445 [candidate division Zixibacteria bacterium]|nr:hypothetical protein [candidate division Zixibacteria bacterium]
MSAKSTDLAERYLSGQGTRQAQKNDLGDDIMETHIISLDKKSNPDFYKLNDEYVSLINRWNDINNKLHRFRIPKVLLFGTKNKLITIEEEIRTLQKDFLDWQARARNFFGDPHYIVNSSQKGDLIFTHSTTIMGYMLTHLDSNMVLLAENYNKVWSIYNDQINFLIAISAFLLSFAGLILGIITFIN